MDLGVGGEVVDKGNNSNIRQLRHTTSSSSSSSTDVGGLGNRLRVDQHNSSHQQKAAGDAAATAGPGQLPA